MGHVEQAARAVGGVSSRGASVSVSRGIAAAMGSREVSGGCALARQCCMALRAEAEEATLSLEVVRG